MNLGLLSSATDTQCNKGGVDNRKDTCNFSGSQKKWFLHAGFPFQDINLNQQKQTAKLTRLDCTNPNF